MIILYILMLVFVGCSKSNSGSLTFKEKIRILHLINHTLNNTEDIDNFLKELKLEEYKEKLESMIKLSDSGSISGKVILFEAIEEDDVKVLESYYNYQKEIFDSSIKRNHALIKNLLKEICSKRALRCLEYLVKVLVTQSDCKELVDTSEMIKIILENKVEDVLKYKELKEMHQSVVSDKKNIADNFNAQKPSLDIKDITSVGIGIGSIGLGALKLSEDKPLKSALIIGGALLIAVPTYLYWKSYSKYNKELSLNEIKIKNIEKEIYLSQSTIDEIKKEIEQKELSMIECLLKNFSVFISDEFIEKSEKAKKERILEYLKAEKNIENKGTKKWEKY